MTDYNKKIIDHYVQEAEKHQLSGKSTMLDQNIRKLEIENILKYLNGGDHCLEAGCGNGYASIEISKAKPLKLSAFDSTKEMIDLANKQPKEDIKGKVEFFEKNILDLSSNEKFDVVYTVRCIINLLGSSKARAAGLGTPTRCSSYELVAT